MLELFYISLVQLVDTMFLNSIQYGFESHRRYKRFGGLYEMVQLQVLETWLLWVRIPPEVQIKCVSGYGSQEVSKTLGNSSILLVRANDQIPNVGIRHSLQNYDNIGSIPILVSIMEDARHGRGACLENKWV